MSLEPVGTETSRLAFLAAISLLAVAMGTPAAGQSSADFHLDEHVFNAGGHPEAGVALTSTSYRVSLDSLGEGLVGQGLSSDSYGMEGSFGGAYLPPGEVENLRFADAVTLVWDAEPSVGAYNLYRDLLSALTGPGLGDCAQQDLPGETATEAELPPTADGYLYLVTAENRLGEEGTKGRDSFGSERPHPSPCP
jgi:hypothetical protein